MPPAAAREKEELGTPQTPAGDFAPCTPFKFALLGAPQITAGDFAPCTPFKFALLGAPQTPAGGLRPLVTCPPDRFPLLNSYKDF